MRVQPIMKGWLARVRTARLREYYRQQRMTQVCVRVCACALACACVYVYACVCVRACDTV